MAHWTQRRQRVEAYAKAGKNGFYKAPPPSTEEQARHAEGVNRLLESLKKNNVQLQLI
jgi:hypothetical protein